MIFLIEVGMMNAQILELSVDFIVVWTNSVKITKITVLVLSY